MGFSWVVVRSQAGQGNEASTDLGKAVRHKQEKLEEDKGNAHKLAIWPPRAWPGLSEEAEYMHAFPLLLSHHVAHRSSSEGH